MKFLLILIAFIGGIISGCRKDSVPSIQNVEDLSYVIFGTYHGECGGAHCIDIYKIEGASFYEDTTDQYPGLQNVPYSGQYIIRPDSDDEAVSEIYNSIPAMLLSDSTKIYGQPDSYDQGGFYLEIKQNETVNQWFIDTDPENLPPFILSFRDTLQKYTEWLRYN